MVTKYSKNGHQDFQRTVMQGDRWLLQKFTHDTPQHVQVSIHLTMH